MALEFLGAKYGARCAVYDSRDVARVVSVNRKIRQQTEDAQNWAVVIELLGRDRGLRRRAESHRLKHKRNPVPFLIPMPQDVKSLGFTPSGSLAVAVNKDGGMDSVTCTASSSVDVLEGQYLTFSNHKKVYRIMEDVTVTRARRVVPIYPDLVDDVTTAEVVSLEPNLYAVHDFAAYAQGSHPMDGETEHYALFSLTEYLE